jgi:transitional endoplasmic reticulum ATPase
MKDVILFTARLLPPIVVGTVAGTPLNGALHLSGIQWLLAMLICTGLGLLAHWRFVLARRVMTAATLAGLLFATGQASEHTVACLSTGAVLWLAWRALRRHKPSRGAGAPGITQSNFASPSEATPRQRAPQQAFALNDRVLRPRFRFDAVLGMAETKGRVLDAAQQILGDPSRARNGILLFGPPGNGKTLFAEALAGELGIPFFSLAYQDVASKWINETPERVKAAFAEATRLNRAVLFIDEIDSWIKRRDQNQTHAMDRDLTVTMITEITRLRSSGSGIVLVAASNDLEWLDEAAIRAGRFDFKIEVPAPDPISREALLSRSTNNSLVPNSISAAVIKSLAARWTGFSAARLMAVGPELADMRRAGLFANAVSFDIAMQAMRRIQGSRGQLPEQTKAIDDIIMPPASAHELKKLALRLRHAHRLEAVGGALPRGALFFGPPGTGKTLAAVALAKASGWAFISTTGAELLHSNTEWKRIFRLACDLRPCILFLDEADDVLGARSGRIAPLTNQILASLDGAGGRVPDVLIIAATNFPEGLDSAVLRGGQRWLRKSGQSVRWSRWDLR